MSRTYSKHKSGTIVDIKHGVAYAEIKSLITNASELKADLIGIEEDEVTYLRKIPIDERLKNHEMGIFGRIKNLAAGDKCLYKSEKYTIKYINNATGGRKFCFKTKVLSLFLLSAKLILLQGLMKGNSLEVDESEIELVEVISLISAGINLIYSEKLLIFKQNVIDS